MVLVLCSRKVGKAVRAWGFFASFPPPPPPGTIRMGNKDRGNRTVCSVLFLEAEKAAAADSPESSRRRSLFPFHLLCFSQPGPWSCWDFSHEIFSIQLTFRTIYIFFSLHAEIVFIHKIPFLRPGSEVNWCVPNIWGSLLKHELETERSFWWDCSSEAVTQMMCEAHGISPSSILGSGEELPVSSFLR